MFGHARSGLPFRAVRRRPGARIAAGAWLGAWLGVSGAASADCVATAADAERAWSIPPGLLLAIGRVESGRYDPARRAVAPWPWTVNAGGQGAYFPDAAGAAAHVAGLQRQGVRSIDVGCFQVNLMHHPGAFASPAEGFDPARNADYAARFLASLYERTGDWPTAAARYHSATPGLADAYRARVLAAWSRLHQDTVQPGARSNHDAVRPGAPGATSAPLVQAIVARLPSMPLPRPVLAGGVRVFTPGEPGMDQPSRAGLPRVVVPGQPSSLLRPARA